MKNLLFVTVLVLPTVGWAQFNPSEAPFHHGVASGDALSDRVIIWTRITPSNPTDTYNVNWQMATDAAMSNVVQNGTFSTDASRDFTVKVDVTGLQPNQWYYYRFEQNGTNSIVGRTRTMPTQMVDRLKFAVVSCQSFGSGVFFNSYNHIANRTDLDAVIHLGDYIYEGSGALTGNGIQVQPGYEIVSVSDYRLRYASYRLDTNLRRVHAQWPMYCVWDDHESTNNSWSTGADNHQPDTEGPWDVRLANSKQAYFEWIPIRANSPGGNTSIYRAVPMGPLADLVLIDTRIEARDQQVGTTSTEIDNASRTMLGSAQKQWFKQQLQGSSAKWKLVGNQVMFAPLELPAIPIIFPNGGIVNDDQWDGYRAERKEIIEFLHNNSIDNTVILTGDIHTSWGNDIPHHNLDYDPNTGAGSVAVEFVTTSITSGNSPVNIGAGIITAANPHMKYIDLSNKGYVLLDVDQQRVLGKWIYVSSIDQSNYTTTETAALVCIDGQNFLRPESALGLNDQTPKKSPISLNVFPNPASNAIKLSIGLSLPTHVQGELIDVMGKKVKDINLGKLAEGSHTQMLDIDALRPGLYMVKLGTSAGFSEQKLFFKQ